MRPSYQAAVAAWRDHLEDGGTTPWCDFIPDEQAAAPGEGSLPAPVNLELLRRLNMTGVPPRPSLVLTAASPGRGMVEQRLPWPGSVDDGRTPLQPDALPPIELTRLAASLLARLVSGLEPVGSVPAARRRVHAFGAPVDVARIRASARAPRFRRWTPGAVIVAPPLPGLLTQVWSARVQRGRILPWARFAARAATSLPAAARLDVLVREARRWHDPERIHVVFGQPDHPALLLGARPSPGRPEVADLSPTATELLRRCNVATRLWAPDRRTPLRRSLVERLPGDGPGLAIPPRHRGGIGRQAELIVAAVAGSGVELHGDPASWVATVDLAGRAAPEQEAVAELAIATLGGVLRDIATKEV